MLISVPEERNLADEEHSRRFYEWAIQQLEPGSPRLALFAGVMNPSLLAYKHLLCTLDAEEQYAFSVALIKNTFTTGIPSLGQEMSPKERAYVTTLIEARGKLGLMTHRYIYDEERVPFDGKIPEKAIDLLRYKERESAFRPDIHRAAVARRPAIKKLLFEAVKATFDVTPRRGPHYTCSWEFVTPMPNGTWIRTEFSLRAQPTFFLEYHQSFISSLEPSHRVGLIGYNQEMTNLFAWNGIARGEWYLPFEHDIPVAIASFIGACMYLISEAPAFL